MSQANSRVQLPAPLCTSVTGEAVVTAAGTITRFSIGDAVLATALTKGAARGAVMTADPDGAASSANNPSNTGYVNSEVVIVGYGTDHAEEVLLSGSALTSHNQLNADTTGSPVWKYAHSIGEAIVRKSKIRAFRPGSVSWARAGGSTLTDDAKGLFSGSDGGAVTGKVNYSTGQVTVKYAVAPGAGAITLGAELLQDAPDMADPNGQGFFANAPALLMSRDGIPSFIVVSNLGSSTVGVFVEFTRNNGRTFTCKGITDHGVELKGLCSKVIRVPSGTGPVLDGIRIRAGQKQASASSLDADEARIIQDGKIECDFVTAPRNANAGGL